MPRAAPFPSSIFSLVSSTSYPALPTLDDLAALRHALAEQKGQKRKRDDDTPSVSESGRERAAAVVESNEKASRGLEAAERHRMGSVKASPGPGLAKVKKERSVSPSGSIASTSSFKPNSQQPITYAGIKKKKKRALDSDDEGRERSVASPPTHHTTSTSGLKLKINKSRPIDPSPTPSNSTLALAANIQGPGGNIDFSLPPPPTKSLIPPRPGVQPPPIPGPKRQADVDEDFSNTKAPNQVAQPAFWSSVEPYLRDIREDDLVMLNFKADAPELYEIPARGRHYTEVWDEEDGNPIGTTPRLPVPALRHAVGPQQPSQSTGTGHFVPATEMKDEHLVSEHKGLGSLTERIVAGVLGRGRRGDQTATSTTGASPAEGDGDKYSGNREVNPVDVADLEEKMKRELKGVMLLGEHEDFTNVNRDDDEVTAAIRQCQRLLIDQTRVNDARKSRLAEISKHRLAYSEYQASLDGLEKSIEAAWSKRVKKHGAAPKKVTATSAAAAAASAANGGGNGNGRPPVPDNVKKLVHVRQNWINSVGQTMRERPRGEVAGIPTRSIYEGLGDEVDEQVVEDAIVLGLGGSSMEVDDE